MKDPVPVERLTVSVHYLAGSSIHQWIQPCCKNCSWSWCGEQSGQGLCSESCV